MKKLILIAAAILISLPVFCQEEKMQKLENLENNHATKTETESNVKSDTLINKSSPTIKKDTVEVNVGNEIFSVKEAGDETRVKVGKKEYRVKEDNDGVVVYRSSQNRYHKRDYERFKGHWAGIEFGFNNYATSNRSIVLPDDINYMTLNSGKSSNFNINFTQLSMGLCRHIGFVTGLGLNWNNYRFDGNNNIAKGDNGVIEELDPGAILEKSKLATLFLTVPFMLEVQVPVNHNHLSLAAGPIGALKLSSHTKMVFKDGEKIKSNGDFSLNMLRYGLTGRVGYGNFQLYGTYYKTPLFSTGKGPGGVDLYPFEIGVALTFND